MKFREWIKLDEIRYGGLWARWKAQFPNVPDYVLKQMYINHISPGMRNEIDPDWYVRQQQQAQQQQQGVQQGAQQHQHHGMTPDATAIHQPQISTPADPSATVGWTPTPEAPAQTPRPRLSSHLPSDIINQRDMLSGLIWSKKPQVVSVSPLSFDPRTMSRFVSWRFGHAPIERVRDDANRTQTQRKLASERQEGENEPIIMVDLGKGTYQLIEGFHRTASYLLQGAPPDQVQLIQNGQMDKLNFGTWKPVSVKAYIGRKSETSQNPYIAPQNAMTPQAATAGYNGPAA